MLTFWCRRDITTWSNNEGNDERGGWTGGGSVIGKYVPSSDNNDSDYVFGNEDAEQSAVLELMDDHEGSVVGEEGVTKGEEGGNEPVHVHVGGGGGLGEGGK